MREDKVEDIGKDKELRMRKDKVEDIGNATKWQRMRNDEAGDIGKHRLAKYERG
jgi:hypothetical protein